MMETVRRFFWHWFNFGSVPSELRKEASVANPCAGCQRVFNERKIKTVTIVSRDADQSLTAREIGVCGRCHRAMGF